MSYESAPATEMVATECACCGRPLLDAVSVEAGVGPDCRAKYGYGEAQAAADWRRVAFLLAGDLAQPLAAAWQADAQAAANVLVRAIASGRSGPRHGQRVAALAALGFAKLAGKLLARAHGIIVEEAGDELRVRAPFCPAFNEAIHRVRGARWVPAEKVRMVPARERAELWAALKTAFPRGTLIAGPKGFTVL